MTPQRGGGSPTPNSKERRLHARPARTEYPRPPSLLEPLFADEGPHGGSAGEGLACRLKSCELENWIPSEKVG